MPVRRTTRPVAGAGLAAGLLVLAGCATQAPPPVYVPIAQAESYGYADRQLGKSSYEVSYVTPERRVSANSVGREAELDSMATQAEEIAQLRAAELALENEHAAFKVVDRRTDAAVTVQDDLYPGYYPFHAFRYGRRHRLYHHPFDYPSAYFRRAYAQVRARLTVEMLPGTAEDGLDAAAERLRLREKYLAGPGAAGDEPSGE